MARTLDTRSLLVLLALALPACGGDTPVSDTEGPANAGDAGPTPPELGAPLDAPTSEVWTWIPIEGSRCGDGTEAGVGVNFTTQSRDLVIWFQGNGVCYNAFSCQLFQGLLGGMGPDPLDHLWWGDKATPNLGIFNRNDPANPLRTSNFIAFPHCGVDGHTADQEVVYPPAAPVQQRGYKNVSLAIPRILATFQDASRIVVAGFSAGGIGAAANYHQIATGFEALGKPPPFLIADAGPILPPPYAGPNATTSLQTGWGLATTIDTWCPTCATEGYHAGYEQLSRMHPGLRSAIISSYADVVATPLYALLNASAFDGARFEAGLREMAVWTASYRDSILPSVHREFYYGGGRHGALVVANLDGTPGLAEFLGAQLDGSPTWESVVP